MPREVRREILPGVQDTRWHSVSTRYFFNKRDVQSPGVLALSQVSANAEGPESSLNKRSALYGLHESPYPLPRMEKSSGLLEIKNHLDLESL